MKKLLLVIAALTACAASARNMALGVNLGDVLDYEVGDMFADAAKEARPFAMQGGAVDANGWPVNNGEQTYFKSGGLPGEAGTYKMSMLGNCTPTLGGSTGWTISNIVYTAGTNTTTCDVTDDGTATTLGITFVGCAPKNITLYRPGLSAATGLWNPAFLKLLAPYNPLRHMGVLSTNFNTIVNWADRTPVGYATQQHSTIAFTSPDQYQGWAWEYSIALSNATSKDMWINIPTHVTDDYITQLATLIKGTLNPDLKVYVEYSNEIWNSQFQQFYDIRDYGNCEADAVAWAPSTAYTTSQYVTTAAGNCYSVTTAGTSAGSGTGPSDTTYQNHVSDGTATVMFVENTIGKTGVLAWDGETNQVFFGYRYAAKRTRDISRIFRTVFGDAAMMTRIRPVLMGQLSHTSTVEGMKLLADKYGDISQDIYATGCAPYFNISTTSSNDATLTTDRIFTEFPASIATLTQQVAAYVAENKSYGLKTYLYEGGAGIVGGTALTVKNAAGIDPRMGDMYTAQIEALRAAGVDEYTPLGIVGSPGTAGDWGIYRDPYDLPFTSPKAAALIVFSQYGMHPKLNAAPLVGTTPSWTGQGGNVDNTTGTWQFGGLLTSGIVAKASWNVFTQGAGWYRLAYSYGTFVTTAIFNVIVDGTLVATDNLPNTSPWPAPLTPATMPDPTTTPPRYVFLNAGANSIEIDSMGTGFPHVYSITVTDN